DRYCGNVDIRTSSKYGDPHISYENCTVVEGNVIIAVYNDTAIDESAYAIFKTIRVVTGFVVVFFTENLRSLSRVLPNLRIIGGDDLIDDYSLIVYSNVGLYDIGLSKLTAILNGGVYSAGNGNLCYVRSINWNKLLEASDRHIYIDEGSNLKAEHSDRCLTENGKSMCWSNTTCQKGVVVYFKFICIIRGPGCDDKGQRCHEQCLGGCFIINDPGSCYYCRNVAHEGKCIESCPPGMFELKVPRRISLFYDNLKFVDEEDSYKCKKCVDEKGCVKKCNGDFLLHDGAELKRLFYGECEIIDGNLEIELTDKVGYYMAGALDETLSRIKVITGYLIVRFSTSLASLRSFKNLERIGGKSLYQNRFALAVFDNKNLVELLDTNDGKGLIIENGTVQFQNNPQLCYEEIMKLVRYANLQNSSIDASPFSNGDQAICKYLYAYYVQTKVVKHNGSRQGFSKVDFFRTRPFHPSEPDDFQYKASVFYAKPLPDSGYNFTECAVKRSPLTDDTLSRKHFIAEGQLMKNFDTTFIIKLYGISAGKGQPALIFLEYMENGNLRDLLRGRRCKQEQDAVNMEQCFLWGAQIADAMAYLEAYQFVHRDLAARNILVDGKENVKLGDFGLTRDVYYHEYYRPSGARPLPVRWMSPETMRDGIFTSKSDVWSYGIVLYEIFTLGERPYPHVDNDLVFDYVEERNVNKKPFGCPSFWYDLMLECWHFQPNSRPTFAEIVTKLLPFVQDPDFIDVGLFFLFSLCKSNRRPNGVIKNVKKEPELKALQNGSDVIPIESKKQFRIINNMGSLNHTSKPSEYSRVTIEEDSV
uniref:receptor protein-tyrosine kinase n=1 Tax=Syphacia muris TaxID=451379 RepID=A0A0N5AQ89_9BILA